MGPISPSTSQKPLTAPPLHPSPDVLAIPPTSFAVSAARYPDPPESSARLFRVSVRVGLECSNFRAKNMKEITHFFLEIFDQHFFSKTFFSTKTLSIKKCWLYIFRSQNFPRFQKSSLEQRASIKTKVIVKNTTCVFF